MCVCKADEERRKNEAAAAETAAAGLDPAEKKRRAWLSEPARLPILSAASDPQRFDLRNEKLLSENVSKTRRRN